MTGKSHDQPTQPVCARMPQLWASFVSEVSPSLCASRISCHIAVRPSFSAHPSMYAKSIFVSWTRITPAISRQMFFGTAFKVISHFLENADHRLPLSLLAVSN